MKKLSNQVDPSMNPASNSMMPPPYAAKAKATAKKVVAQTGTPSITSKGSGSPSLTPPVRGGAQPKPQKKSGGFKKGFGK